MYFDRFPLIEYGNSGNLDSEVRKIARDIIRRVAFNQRSKEELSVYESYIIENDDTPEIVADRVYGDPKYHWVVLLFNEIINPYYDWPLGDQTLENYIEGKYPGNVLYLSSATVSPTTGLSGTGDVCGLTFAADETVFLWAGTGDDIGVVFDYTKKGLVWDYDPTFFALTVVNETGRSDFRSGDVIVKVTGDTKEYAYVERVVDNRYALHHFETKEGTTGDANWLNPLASVDGIPVGQTGAGPTNGFVSIGGTGPAGSNKITPVAFSETNIARYMGLGDVAPVNTNAVTNNDYEFEVNENKRFIRILNPAYLSEVVDQFESRIKSSTQRTIFDNQFLRVNNSGS